jgi:hypothetical protein
MLAAGCITSPYRPCLSPWRDSSKGKRIPTAPSRPPSSSPAKAAARCAFPSRSFASCFFLPQFTRPQSKRASQLSIATAFPVGKKNLPHLITPPHHSNSMANVPKLRACDRCAAIKQVCDREARESCSRCTREFPAAGWWAAMLEELNIELMDVSLRTGTAMCDYSGS